MKIAALTILYNPTSIICQNIDTYIHQVDRLYVVDNSEHYNELLINKLKKNRKIIYINNKNNKGVAYALNIGARYALKDKYKILLTLDQDSKVSENMIPLMLDCWYKLECDKVGILSPFHACINHVSVQDKGCVIKESVMTSGNFLSLRAYNEIGIFNEDLFIDYIDNEYCFRMSINGYKIIQVSEAILNHKLGELSKHNLFGKNIYCYNYIPIRYYYRTRNVISIRKSLKVFWLKEILKDLIKIILYEKNMLKKILYIYFGIIDAIKGKKGKYDR